MAEEEAQYNALQSEAPTYNPKTNAPETMFKEATPAENQAAGNVQPVKSPQQQAVQQLTGGGQQQPQQPQQPLNRGSGFIYGSGDPNATLGEDLGVYAQRTLEGLGSVGMGIIDFGSDLIGRIPGAEWIDDAWDAKTKFKNPGFQKVREVSSVLVPSIGVGAASRVSHCWYDWWSYCSWSCCAWHQPCW